MKKLFIFAIIVVFILGAVGFASADDSAMLKANEKKAWEKATKVFSAERQLNVQQFKEL